MSLLLLRARTEFIFTSAKMKKRGVTDAHAAGSLKVALFFPCFVQSNVHTSMCTYDVANQPIYIYVTWCLTKNPRSEKSFKKKNSTAPPGVCLQVPREQQLSDTWTLLQQRRTDKELFLVTLNHQVKVGDADLSPARTGLFWTSAPPSQHRRYHLFFFKH